jgi:hypothetical protein
MLAPGHPDGPTRLDTCACCCTYPCVLHLMCPAPPLTFFEHAPPPAATAPHSSSYYIAPARESMCVGPPSYMREREHSVRTPMRESTTHVPWYERERDHSARTPICEKEREYSARAQCERGREHSAHAHALRRLHAPLCGTMPGGEGAPSVACACPRVR